MMMFLMEEYTVAIVLGSIVFLAINGAALYVCIKKKNRRDQVRTRMMELQANMAANQNMGLFQMQTHPDFPRTIHV